MDKVMAYQKSTGSTGIGIGKPDKSTTSQVMDKIKELGKSAVDAAVEKIKEVGKPSEQTPDSGSKATPNKENGGIERWVILMTTTFCFWFLQVHYVSSPHRPRVGGWGGDR